MKIRKRFGCLFSAESYFPEFRTENIAVNPTRKLAFRQGNIDFTLIGARGRFDINGPPLTPDLCSGECGIYIGSTRTFTGVIQQINEGDILLLHNTSDF